MNDEFRLHVEMRAQDLMRSGLSPAEALRRARCEFGSPERYKAEARASRGLHWLDAFRFSWLDVRYATRSFRKRLGPTGMAILSLGLGIGASTTMFSVIDALDFRPLPFREPDRLVWLTEVSSTRFPGCARCPDLTSLSTATYWEAQATSYQGMAFQGHTGVYVDAAGVSESISIGLASPGFLELLGVRLALGRAFSAEDTAAARDVAILSHAMWMARFNADPAVIGAQLEYFADITQRERHTSTIVGVLPQAFRFGSDYPFWLGIGGASQRSRSPPITVVGRLGPGLTRSVANAELQVVHARLAALEADPAEARHAVVLPLRENLRMAVGEGRATLFSITLIVLCVAMLNVAGLFVARAAARHQEFTVRRALGAPRSRLIRQLLAEGVMLGLASGVLGAVIAVWGVRIAGVSLGLDHYGPAVRIDHRVLAFGIGLSIIAGLVTALLPARSVGRADLFSALRGPAGLSPKAVGGRGPGALLATQVAAGLILLTTGGLLSTEYVRLRYRAIGYDPTGVYIASIAGPAAYRTTPELLRGEAVRARARIEALPGIAAASLGHSSAIDPAVVRAEDRVGTAPPDEYVAVDHVEHDFFTTLGIQLAAGRTFSEADDRSAPPVAILNRSAAARFWADQAVLGRRVFVGDSAGAGEWLTVIGVADDVERGELVRRGYPRLYRPLAQSPIYHPRMQMHLRLTDSRPATLQAVQSALRESLGRPISALRSHEAELGERFAGQRIHALAIDLFAAVALLLAALGIYASVAYAVTRRTREIAVRIALGATHVNVLTLFARDAVIVALVGLILGCAGSFALSGMLQSFLSATNVTDLRAFGGAALVMTCAVLIAACLPARRAMAVEPTLALRSE